MATSGLKGTVSRRRLINCRSIGIGLSSSHVLRARCVIRRQVLEARVLGDKRKLSVSDGAVALFTDDDLTDSLCRHAVGIRSEEHTSELQSRGHLVCRLL